ncbi:BCCT family transporter [Ketogulonicigenium vulgare]|uniref:Choline/carnitine/betaine transporter n=1 Tax=Ketogulonicigenium vulgare (strain WSH-001) TaxID=759362 RepID=F9YB40_KETVW|nr:BCCT family transporter [Ketogulonicigenium vulgare]AEM42592.1 Choline/carnitine/betaine transporter [Ketogulonicigenium vulgare WSH-001]ALJ82619.1 BCCT transporter [Ketogulonicigenium vulgare]ANW35373.1 BCCT transporter [Ketogulonicigenium vulgare]AOZ53293.1 Choline/carnitine/betaine transporter [Ketogulonicigenium vulgare]
MPDNNRGPIEPQTPDDAVPAPEGATEIIETDYEIGQDNINYRRRFVFELDIHNIVFSVSALGIVAFTLATLMFQTALGPVFGGLRDFLTNNLDWFFIIAGNVFVLVCIGLIVTPLGRVRLGGPDATPDYNYLSWFSMLFAAGMGIGLMFYGVSEPMGNFTAAFAGPEFGPDGARTDWAPLNGFAGDEEGARRLAMAATIFHWSLHPWSIYAVVALSLALFAYNKGLPLTLRSVFYPIFGERVWGWPGHIIDILAVFATMFGLATSLGIGAQQASAGLEFLFGWTSSIGSMVVLIIIITAIATASVVSGMDKGIKLLSEVNMALALLLLLFVVAVGPTMQILSGFFKNLLAYVEYLPALSNPFGRTDDNFRHGWTAFYWAWWISWSPFVGMFIARVSRGRSVREFLIAVLLIPSLVSTIWMTALGGTAISQVIHQGYTTVQTAALELQLFEMLGHLPLTAISSFVGIILVVVFFITSSDSGSLVIDTISAGGKVNAPVPQRVFWATFEGLVAIALLLGGGLTALQAMAVSTGFPFAIVLLGACYALVKGLMAEPRS